jgi:hypothetical protein
MEGRGMKKLAGLAVLLMLVALGCSKGPESQLVGVWANPQMKDFSAEFKKDHTGVTSATPPSSIPGHPAPAPVMTPFKWVVEKERIKITEGPNNVFYGKLVGKKLEIEVGGAKTILDKVK